VRVADAENPLSPKKLKDHFLKCSNQDCAAMFWSDKNQGYELPYSERQESTQKRKWSEHRHWDIGISASDSREYFFPITHYWFKHQSIYALCAVNLNCMNTPGQSTKANAPLLRCPSWRRDDHKSVAYFAAKEDFGRLPMAKLASRATSKLARAVSKYGR